MAIEEYLVPYKPRTNICFDCQRALGGVFLECVPPCYRGTFVSSGSRMDGKTVKAVFCIEGSKAEDVDLSHYRLPAVSSR